MIRCVIKYGFLGLTLVAAAALGASLLGNRPAPSPSPAAAMADDATQPSTGMQHRPHVSGREAVRVREATTTAGIRAAEPLDEDLLTRLHRRLSSQVGNQKADFLVSVVDASRDWARVKALFSDNAAVHGHAPEFATLQLNIGLTSADLDINDIDVHVQAGHELPRNVANRLAAHGNLDTLRALASRDYFFSTNYVDSSGYTALTELADYATYGLPNASPDEIRAVAAALFRAGVPAQATRKASAPRFLERLLHLPTHWNVANKVALIEAALANGLTVTDADWRAVNAIEDAVLQDSIRSALMGNTQDAREN